MQWVCAAAAGAAAADCAILAGSPLGSVAQPYGRELRGYGYEPRGTTKSASACWQCSPASSGGAYITCGKPSAPGGKS